MRHLAALWLAATLLAACDSPKPSPAKQRQAGVGRMANCPTAVDGATVDITDTADGVVITITAATEAKVDEIRADARHVVDVSRKNPSDVRHTGEGEGGGGLGKCVVVLKDTTVTADDVPGGARITVTPNQREALEALQKEVRERHAKRPR